MASDNKTNAELSRSGVYRLNNSSGVLGNSYGAQLEYMNSKTGENPTDNVRDIGTSKSKTNLNASKISISHEHKESSDYHADELSVTADYDTQRGEMPQWRKLLLDPEKAGYFLSRQWPRIALRASFRSKEPYVVPNEDDKNSSVKEEIPQRNKRTVCVVISCVILVILVVIPTVVLTILAKNDNASTGKSYVKARMGITINSTFKDDFENPESIQYRTFVTEFCTEIGHVYYNETLDNYYGCQVTNLKRGSVVVAFVVYFKQSYTKEEIEINLKSYVKAAGNLLGAFIIQDNSVHVIDVVIEILTSPPQIQNTKIEASTSSFEMPTSIYKKMISATSVLNVSEASSVIYTYTPMLDSSVTSEMISVFTPTLTTDKSSGKTKSEISSNVSLHSSIMLGNTLTTHFTQEYLSGLVSSVTPLSNSISVTKQTDQTDSLAVTSTRNIIETASKVTTISKTVLEDHSTIDVLKILGGTSTFGDFSNDNFVTTMMETSSLKSSTAVSTLAIPESNQNSYTGTTDTVPDGILSSPTAVKTESKDPNIIVTTTTGLRDYFTSDAKSVTSTIGDFSISSPYTTFMSTSSFRSSTTGFAPENNQGTSITSIPISPNVSSSIVTKTSLPEGIQSFFTAGETAQIVTTIHVPNTTVLDDSYAIDVSKSSTSPSRVSLNYSALTTSMPTNSYKSPTTNVTLLVPESIPNSFTTGIKISSNLSPSITPFATSFPEGILNASSSFYSTTVSKFMTNGITRSLADIISNSVTDKTKSFYSSQVFSTISVLSTVTSYSPLKYIPSSLPPSSKEHEIKTDLTYVMPSSVLQDTPLLPSYSKSVQMTTSQNSASESILNINRSLTTESIIRQPSQTTVKPITTQTETEMFSVSKAIYTSIIDSLSYNTYSMPKTQVMSPSQSNYKPFTSTVIVPSDTQSKLMSASTDLYSNRYILPSLASSVLTTVSSTVSYFLAGNVQSTKSSLLESSSSVFSTEAPIQDLITCSNVTAELLTGPVTMICTLDMRANFDKIAIYHGPANQPLFAVELFENGTKNYLKSDSNINANFNVSKVEITFQNVACYMDGEYKLGLVKSFNYSFSWTTGHLLVLSQPEIPTLTLNADQVIDLVFPDGNYYRAESKHVCEGNIGHPPGRLAIDIMYVNGTSFETLPNDSYVEFRTIANYSCSNYERINFAIKFSKKMEGATFRCRVPGAFNNGTNQTLTLIPRTFCDCASPSGIYEHPTRCDAIVQCIQDTNIMYPFGVLCRIDQCSNRTIGMCSQSCSAKCTKTKPPDLCIPPTTTPAPSPYIACNESVSVMLYSKPPVISCTLNQTSVFESINITKLSGNSITEIARISRDGDVTLIYTNNNLNVTFAMRTITIRLTNVSCTDEGVYKVDLNTNGVMATAQAHVSVLQRPYGYANLQLNPDQIADLRYYRLGFEHICQADIGYPAGKITIEILKKGETQFALLNITQSISDSAKDCTVRRVVKFGIVFTSEMNEAIIRCRIESDYFPTDPPIYSNNETVWLIPRNFCDCATPTNNYEHPARCDAFVQCTQDENIMYPFGLQCRTAQCSNRSIGMCSNNCSSKCTKTKPPDICIPPTTTPAPSPYVSCNETMSVMLYSKPPVITCTLNQTSVFESINITKIAGNSITEIARISRDGAVTLMHTNENLNVTFAMRIINIRLTNISCVDEGVYRVDLNTNGVMATAQTQLSVLVKPDIPKLTLNADQVVDLVFPDGIFYRSEGLHVCEGGIGNPPSSLAIDIIYANSTKFENISQDSYKEFRSIISLPCSKYETVSFAIKFSEKMEGARLRCRVPTALANDTVQILTLIPRNFCNCANTNSIHEHPTRCDAVVECKQGNGIMYPFGVLCRPDQCSNSLTGKCSFNCSTQNCMKTKPSDLCIPPTTTPAPSPYISCSESLLVMLYSKPPIITCTLNQTSAFESINITKISIQNSMKDIARILPNGTVVRIGTDDNLTVTFTMGVITINIMNATCTDEGVYRVDLNINGAKAAAAQTQLSVFQKPSGIAKLLLNPDQIENRYYKLGYEHRCEADIGYPAGKIHIEILKKGENQFSLLNVPQSINNPVEDCPVMRVTKFGIDFTSDMNEAVIRCRIESNLIQSGPPIYSNNETVSLIPGNFCNCSTPSSIHEHPTRCDAFIQCVPGNGHQDPLGVLCTDQCSSSNSGICSHNCSTQYCTKAKPADLCIPLTTTPAPSAYISCSEPLFVMMYSNKVVLSCTLNQTSTFEYINITKITLQNSVIDIARILSSGFVIQSYSYDILNVTFAMSIVTLTIHNVTCTDEGVYRMVVSKNSLLATAQTQLSVFQRPRGYPTLTLNPDQIVGNYKKGYEHICQADIGYPAGKIEVEILKNGETRFSLLNVVLDDFSITNKATNCTIMREMKFGIIFSSDMNKAVIRCRIMFQNDPPIFSNNGTVSLLLDSNYCDNSTNNLYYKPHPTDCTKFIQCQGRNAYAMPCLYGLCYGATSFDFCNDGCNEVNCSTVQTDDRYQTTTENSQDKYCNNSTKDLYYKSHPTDCRKFIQCERTTAYERTCQFGLCFGVTSIEYCNDPCDDVNCGTTTSQTTGERIQTTTTTGNSNG